MLVNIIHGFTLRHSFFVYLVFVRKILCLPEPVLELLTCIKKTEMLEVRTENVTLVKITPMLSPIFKLV